MEDRYRAQHPYAAPMGGARAVATEVLIRVLSQGHSLTDTLSRYTDPLEDPRDRALARALCFGVMRQLPRLRGMVARLMEKPLKRNDADVSALLLLGLYQLLHTRLPPHAAVAETVDVAAARGKPWAKALINGVLRNFQRRRDEILQSVDRESHSRLAHPRWLAAAVRNAWPKDWVDILMENNRKAPMTLRVNVRRMSRDAYLARHPGLATVALRTASGVQLSEATDVSRVPGFDEGVVSVQDGGAQLAAGLLELAPGQRVLDACAAPGGKMAHILEQERGLAALVALEQDPARLASLTATLTRLELAADVRCADAGAPEGWWDGEPFHRILLDVPCSGSGVIRRHPDIKFHRRPDDIAQYAASQARLLNALWPLLAPGGLLLYVTCSVLPQENRQQIEGFLKRHPDAREKSIDADWGRAAWGGSDREEGKTGPGRQILPGENGMDGFYYARIEKMASGQNGKE
uniref:16S rRNA (cytosine(967)-C(5))-methyltransferase n=1 Tax=Candidatus Kentrum eta TaxID=2126337 RepID=A0A450V1U7_9GAMM|nr:MAG: 16S rRNA (cytosine967-C5)-methyltransferase [Candidatus Kentron sp. H]VFJ98751.1 MAG: 16S rRNA (cytosine967-C5)-methyltransferase [Candidatus Kentron sp. H]VFK04305.1 MAG: 16S rRNA (cytosine967-C5)-methyltransferase [Candidatus Kentron sp. H]